MLPLLRALRSRPLRPRFPTRFLSQDAQDAQDHPSNFFNSQDLPPTAIDFDKYSTPERASPLRHHPGYRLHCRSSRNNTYVTLTDEKGSCIGWWSGGSIREDGRLKFKGSNRSTFEAGYQCAIAAFRVVEKVAQTKSIGLDLFFKGFGQGRDAMKTAMLATEGEKIRPLVRSIQDRTPIKIGGTRAPKARRL